MPRKFMGLNRRPAATFVLVLVAMPVLIGMAALTIDIGVIYSTKADLQDSADAAALAAIQVIANADNYANPRLAATETAMDIVHRNGVMGHAVTLDPARDVIFGRATYDAGTASYNFTADDVPTNAVRVRVRHTADSPNGQAPLYFAAIFGRSATDITGQAATTFVRSRYDEQSCGYVPGPNEVVLCAPVGDCGVDSDDSGAFGANGSDDSLDSDDSDDSDDSATGDTNCFREDSESGPGGANPSHTIVVDVSAAPGYLANGATSGPCPCVAGKPNNPKHVDVCHVSANNANNSFVISVSPAALAAHLAHGDTAGNCPGTGTLRVLLFE